MSPITTTPCPNCGEPLSADVIFCEHCFTLNPMVREFLERNPKPYPKDYMTVDSTCPYCSKRQRNRVIDEFLTKNICTPIHRCKKCGGYFVQTKGLEWSVAPSSFRSKKWLLTDLLIKNEYNIIEIFVDTPLICAVAAFLYLLLNFPIGFLWLHFTLPKAIRKSNLRLEQNPDYPQILASMGYGGYMDEKYDAPHCPPPKRQTFKEFLKEAFTFD